MTVQDILDWVKANDRNSEINLTILQDMVEAVSSTTDFSKVTATTADVKSGKKFYNNQGMLVDGTYVPVDTEDATAIASDIMNGKTAYAKGQKVIGTYIPLDTSDATATINDIVKDKTAYVDGQKLTGVYVPLDTSDATAVAGDIVKDKTAYVDGQKVVGTLDMSHVIYDGGGV